MFRTIAAAVAITLPIALTACSSGAATPSAGASGSTDGGEIVVGLITKTETNPFFVKMKEGAQAKADELGAKLLTGAGARDGDNEGQVTAMENMINAGAKGILITPSDTKAIVPSIQKAREQGVVVIALDTTPRSARLAAPGPTQSPTWVDTPRRPVCPRPGSDTDVRARSPSAETTRRPAGCGNHPPRSPDAR